LQEATKNLTATSNANSQAISTSTIDAEPLLPTFTSGEELRFQRRYDNGFDIPDPQYLLWLKDRHSDRFQELKSSEGPSLAAIFNESSQSDSLGLGLLNSATVTPVDVEQQVDMASADTVKSPVQTLRQDMSDNAFLDMQE